MRKDTIKKIAVFDQSHPVAEQLMAKAESLFDAGQTLPRTMYWTLR